jgi:hypothetical protein
MLTILWVRIQIQVLAFRICQIEREIMKTGYVNADPRLKPYFTRQKTLYAKKSQLIQHLKEATRRGRN